MELLSHLEKLYESLHAMVSNIEQNQKNIKDLQADLGEVSEQLQELMFQVKRMQDRLLSQRENDELRMKNFRLHVEVLLGKKLPDDESNSDDDEST